MRVGLKRWFTFPAWSLVKRELLSTLRGVRAFLLLLLFVCAAVLYAWLNWPASVSQSGGGAFMMASMLSRSMMQTFIFLLFGACTLFVPAFSASAIVVERERATYDLLRMTLIRPSGILFAKLLNAVGLFLLILVGLAPVLSVAFFLIGVDPVQMGQALAVVAATTIACAAAGVLSSAVFNRTLFAMASSYVLVIMLMIGPLILAYLVSAIAAIFVNVRAVFGFMEQVAVVLSPVMTMMNLLIASVGTGGLSGTQFVLSLCYQAVFALSCLVVALFFLRRPPRSMKVEDSKPIDNRSILAQRRLSWPFYIIDPLRRKKPIEDGRNAMLVREMRWGLLNRGTTLIRVFYCTFVVYFFAGAAASVDARSFDTMGRWMLIQIVMTIIIAPALMANVFTKEYELRNVDMLRMTLLRPSEMILGKLFAGYVSAAPLLAAAVLSCLPLILLGERNWSMLGVGYATLIVCVTVSLSLTLTASIFTRRTAAALVLAYFLSAVAFVGLWAAAAVLGADESVASFLSPLGAYIRGAGLGYFSPFSTSRAEVERLGYWLVAMGAWTAVAGTLIAASIALFWRFRMTDR